MNGSNCDKSTIVGPDIACHCFSAGGVRANNGSNEGGMLLSAALFFMAARGVECFGHPPTMEVDRRGGEGGRPGRKPEIMENRTMGLGIDNCQQQS